MNRTLHFFLFSLIVCTTSWGQQGFSKKYDFDRPSASFTGLIFNNGLLNTYGVLYHDSIPNKQGIFFAKIDTNGNILSLNSFFDSLGDDYVTRLGGSIIKLSDGSGFVMIGSLLGRANGFLLFTDNDGNKIRYKEYPDPSTIVDFYEKIIEIDDGFVMCGTKVKNNNAPYAFIAKLNKNGDKIWEKSYNSPFRDWYFNSVYIESQNSYITGISSVPPLGTPVFNLNSQTIILATDSTGQETWRWESPISLEEGGAGSLQKTFENKWIYLSARSDLNIQQSSWTYQPKAILRDSNFNLMWEIEFGLSNSAENQLTGLSFSPEGNWVASGFMKNPLTPNCISGTICKFSNNGDSIWYRQDTLIYYPNAYTAHYISSSVILPSGSVIACGSIDDYSVAKSSAWLLKVNADGCIDTFECSVSSQQTPKINGINLFPNPVADSFTISFPNNIAPLEVFIVNILGQIVYHDALNKTSKYLNISVESWEAGVYLIYIKTTNGVHKTMKIIVK